MKDTDQIKQKLDIVELVNEYTPLKKAGRNFTARCPFHAEKTPSFIVSPDRQTWHCFGACSEGGDIFSFYMKQEQVTFPEALKDLAEKAGVPLTGAYEHDSVWKERKRLYEINHLASEYYHYLLTTHPHGEVGRLYQKSRKITDKTARTFMLGYAPNGWRNLIPFLKRKGYHEDEIEKAGLIIKGNSGYYDRFRGRFMFTLRDHREQIIGFSGRVLGESKQAKYINSPETPLYHKGSVVYGLDTAKDAIRSEGYVIIVEGEFDVLSAFQAGFANTVAIKGTALTQDQLKLLKRFAPEMRLALDMDIAGDSAARKGIEMADELDLAVRIIEIPGGKDLDEALNSNIGPVKEAITHASSIYDFVLNSSLKRHTRKDAFEKKKISTEVLPIYARITNPIVRNHYVKLLAETLTISEDAVLEELERGQKRSRLGTSTHQPVEHNESSERDEHLEMHLLSLILQGKHPHDHLQIALKSLTIHSLLSSPVQRILEWLKNIPNTEGVITTKSLPSELQDTFNRAYLSDINRVLESHELFKKELSRTIIALKKRELRRKLAEVATKIKSTSDMSTLNEEFNRISAELKSLN